MQYQQLEQGSFLWVLQGDSALHRKSFSLELAQQQFAAPYTVESLVQACGCLRLQRYPVQGQAREASPGIFPADRCKPRSRPHPRNRKKSRQPRPQTLLPPSRLPLPTSASATLARSRGLSPKPIRQTIA